MDDHPTSPHRKTSLPTFASSIPVEIAVLPASTRSSFTRVENSTRPGTSAGDNNDLSDKGTVPDGGSGGGSNSGGGSGRGGAPAPVQPEGEPEEVVSAVEAQAAVVVPQVPQTLVQFLLVSGRRRSMAFVPETAVGRVKELVWNSWPNDWQDERPPAPSFLRILYLGKILQDDDTLTQLNFPSHTPPEPATPTIVHLSIRSFAPREDMALKKKRRMSGSGADASQTGTQDEAGSGCCCVVC